MIDYLNRVRAVRAWVEKDSDTALIELNTGEFIEFFYSVYQGGGLRKEFHTIRSTNGWMLSDREEIESRYPNKIEVTDEMKES